MDENEFASFSRCFRWRSDSRKGNADSSRFDERGDPILITVNQRNSALYSDPGRLLLNGRMIEVRSAEENAILDLLRNASITPLQDDDDRVGAIEILPLSIVSVEMLEILIDTVVNYLESDEYVRIAKDGLSQIEEPWNLRRF